MTERIREWIQWNVPLNSWWKVRKLFKRPHMYFNIYKIDDYSKEYYNKYVNFGISDVGWKWKFNEIRYEEPPYIALALFRKWKIMITWSIKGYDEVGNIVDYDTDYWEFLLNYLYNDKCNKNILDVLHWVGYWSRDSKILKDIRLYITPQQVSLTKKGYDELKNNVLTYRNKVYF